MTAGTVLIRPLEERPEAAAMLARWFVAEWPDYHRGRSLPDVASRFRLVPEVQETFVAEVDGEVVGTAALRGPWESAPHIPPPWIGGLYVIPEHRGRGIAMALIEALVREAAARGSTEVHMSVRVDPAAYIRRGWRIVGRLFAGDENVTVLRRSLT